MHSVDRQHSDVFYRGLVSFLQQRGISAATAQAIQEVVQKVGKDLPITLDVVLAVGAAYEISPNVQANLTLALFLERYGDALKNEVAAADNLAKLFANIHVPVVDETGAEQSAIKPEFLEFFRSFGQWSATVHQTGVHILQPDSDSAERIAWLFPGTIAKGRAKLEAIGMQVHAGAKSELRGVFYTDDNRWLFVPCRDGAFVFAEQAHIDALSIPSLKELIRALRGGAKWGKSSEATSPLKELITVLCGEGQTPRDPMLHLYQEKGGNKRELGFDLLLHASKTLAAKTEKRAQELLDTEAKLRQALSEAGAMQLAPGLRQNTANPDPDAAEVAKREQAMATTIYRARRQLEEMARQQAKEA